MNLVSIIIPMYNEQENVEGCINVLKRQINQKFDVIFIDDGSKDNTLLRLEECLSLDVAFNYKIIKQKNKGAAAARENGIKNTDTKFIMILDCDDVLSDDLIEQIYTKYEQHEGVDLIIPNMQRQSKDGKWESFPFYTDKDLLSPIDCVINSLNGWNIHGCFAIKKIIIEKSYNDYSLYNFENINYINNDEVITRLNFLNSKKIVRSSANYYYCYNPNSTTKKVNEARYLMINNAIILNKIFSDNIEIKSKVTSELIAVIWGTFIYMQKNKTELKNLRVWNIFLKEIINDLSYFKLIGGLGLKKKVQLTILKLAYLL